VKDTDSEAKGPGAAEGVSAAHEAVGKLLSTTRTSRGLDVADVARVLRISQKYLEALEEGRNEDLPGTAYAIGFVRSYAEHLNLDGEEIVRRYKDEAQALGGKTDLIFPKPIPDGGVPGAAVLGLGVVLAAVAYGVWYYNSNNDGVAVVRVEAVPEELAVVKDEAPAPQVEPSVPVEDAAPVEEAAPAVVEEAPEVVEEVVEPVEAVVQDLAAEQAPEVPAEAEASAEAPAEAAEVVVEPTVEAAVEPAAEPSAEVSPVLEAPVAPVVQQPVVQEPVASKGPSRITVRAKSNSWIQVRDNTADRLLFTRLLREGDEYEVPDRLGLRLMTGNAGALELLVDGTLVPAIGEVGEVRRDVELDPDKLKSGTAVTH